MPALSTHSRFLLFFIGLFSAIFVRLSFAAGMANHGTDFNQ
jgi:hypothetical protein